MGVFTGAFPIVPGKEGAARAFAAETIGAEGPLPDVLLDWHA